MELTLAVGRPGCDTSPFRVDDEASAVRAARVELMPNASCDTRGSYASRQLMPADGSSVWPCRSRFWTTSSWLCCAWLLTRRSRPPTDAWPTIAANRQVALSAMEHRLRLRSVVGPAAVIFSALYLLSDVIEAAQGGFSTVHLWLALLAEGRSRRSR